MASRVPTSSTPASPWSDPDPTSPLGQLLALVAPQRPRARAAAIDALPKAGTNEPQALSSAASASSAASSELEIQGVNNLAAAAGQGNDVNNSGAGSNSSNGTGLAANAAPALPSPTLQTAAAPTLDAFCAELLPEATLGLDSTDPQWLSTPLLDPSLTFQLHSDPKASRVIYLDFNGHTTTGTGWNTSTMGSSFYSPAYDIDGNPASFSSAELTRIQQIWQRVASDYAPFDVDVTTQAPPTDWLIRSSSTDINYGIRVVVTSYGPYSSTAGGVAFVGSFTANSDTPAFVYNRTVIGASEAISHEVGHTLGLSHDGTATSTYYGGHGSGETGWAPIMGASYNRSVTTWDTGVYTGTNNGSSSANYGKGPDDLAVITGYNGFGYQPDLVGNSLSTAAALRISGGQVNQFGTIETRQDQDVYSFQLLSGGDLNLSFDPYWSRAYVDSDGIWGGSSSAWATRVSDLYSSTSYVENGSNLDLLVTLTNASGKVIATSNPTGLAASLSVTGLAAGTYGLSLDGTGYGTPTAATPSGYTDADSLGYYRISGTISGAADSPGTLALAASEPLLLSTTSTSTGSTDPVTGHGNGKKQASLGATLAGDSITGLTGVTALPSPEPLNTRDATLLAAVVPPLAAEPLTSLGTTPASALQPLGHDPFNPQATGLLARPEPWTTQELGANPNLMPWLA